MAGRWKGATAWILLGFMALQPLARAQEADGQAYMARLQEAARSQHYSGVYIYQQGQFMLSSHIAHITDETGEHQRVEILDGRTHREFLRHNQEVLSLFPEIKVVLVERRETEHFPAFFAGNPAELTKHYEVSLVSEPGRVAGRPCQIAHLLPLDDFRWGYRVCADAETGLLLKVQTVDATGSVLEQMAFTEVQLGNVDRERLRPRHDVTGWRRMEAGEAIDLQADGWHVTAPSGFYPISQVRRLLKPSKTVSQMVLSDGLAAISVFIEADQSDREQRKAVPGPATQGATSVFRRDYGDYWLTVLGEVPQRTVQAVAENIRYDGDE